MGQHGAKAKEIFLGDDSGDVAVNANGVSVEIRTDGSIFAYTSGDVKKVSTAVNDDNSKGH